MAIRADDTGNWPFSAQIARLLRDRRRRRWYFSALNPSSVIKSMVRYTPCRRLQTIGVEMNQGFSFIDIIILALITGFLVFRLRSVLGRRTGNEKRPPRPNESDNVISMNRRKGSADADEASGPVIDQTPYDDEEDAARPMGGSPQMAGTVDPAAMSGIAQIKKADPTFEEDRFLGGAQMAFEMILQAYAKGDTKTLRDLLADAVYQPFASAIADRKQRGESMESELISFKSITILDAGMKDRLAQLTVRFVTEQMILIRDQAGTVVDGDPSRFDVVTDDWTFERDVASRNPNWMLAVTSTPDA